MTGLTLLASYPKSGNTWLRAFLVSLAAGGRVPDINVDLGAISALSSRRLHDQLADVDCDDLTDDELAPVRAYVSRRAAIERPGLYKTHDANLPWPNQGVHPVPHDAIARVVYVVRDPRDVALSAASFFGKSIAATVDLLADPNFRLGRSINRRNENVTHLVSSWSNHALSWIDAPNLCRHVVRYEDMLASPQVAFGGVCRFLGLASDEDAIAAAIKATAFEQLVGQEARIGFREQPHAATAPFFRSGRAGGWMESLSPDLQRAIVATHGPVMHRFGYID